MTDLKEICALINKVIRLAFKLLDRVQQNNHFSGKSQEASGSGAPSCATSVGTDDGHGLRGRQNLPRPLKHPHISLCFTTFRGDRDWITFSITHFM